MKSVGCGGCTLAQGTQGNLTEKLKYLSGPQAGERMSHDNLWGKTAASIGNSKHLLLEQGGVPCDSSGVSRG